MKKLLFYAAAAGLLFTACQKEEGQPTDDSQSTLRGNTSQISAIAPVPSAFTRKVLIEEFVSVSNGNVPVASEAVSKMTAGYPGRVYSVGLHVSGTMYHSQANKMFNGLTPGTATVPSCMVSRSRFGASVFQSSANLNAMMNSVLNQNTSCGLAIQSSIANNNATITVHSGFTGTYNGNLRLNVYLVEDVVMSSNPLFCQANAGNSDPGSSFFNMGNPIIGYMHRNVLRSVATPDFGANINPTAMVAGGKDVQTFKLDLPPRFYGRSNFNVIAFITDAGSNEVLNVQSTRLGTTKNWN